MFYRRQAVTESRDTMILTRLARNNADNFIQYRYHYCYDKHYYYTNHYYNYYIIIITIIIIFLRSQMNNLNQDLSQSKKFSRSTSLMLVAFFFTLHFSVWRAVRRIIDLGPSLRRFTGSKKHNFKTGSSFFLVS